MELLLLEGQVLSRIDLTHSFVSVKVEYFYYHITIITLFWFCLMFKILKKSVFAAWFWDFPNISCKFFVFEQHFFFSINLQLKEFKTTLVHLYVLIDLLIIWWKDFDWRIRRHWEYAPLLLLYVRKTCFLSYSMNVDYICRLLLLHTSEAETVVAAAKVCPLLCLFLTCVGRSQGRLGLLAWKINVLFRAIPCYSVLLFCTGAQNGLG